MGVANILRTPAACCFMLAAIGHATELTLTAANRLPFARDAQTIELTAAQLAPLGVKDLATVHVRNADGQELAVQAVDTDFDVYRKPDRVIFQADFRANETRAFTVSAGARQVFAKEQFKAFGRFVRERFDDFAWENDRIAHRTYGRALETWEGEPLASSTIDIWSKRTPRMVVNDWYLADRYHEDTGEGADFYSAGSSRGCGGNGLWAAGRLWTSRNFVDSRVLASGPIRVMFELEYAPYEVDGVSVSEVKRITLDAGSQLDHFRSTYRTFTRPGRERALTTAIGLKKVEGEKVEFDADRGWLLKWEKMEQGAGEQGLAIVSAGGRIGQRAEDGLNHLVLAPVPANGVVSYWAGFAWNRAGRVADAAAWKKYVDEFAQGTRSPIAVSVSPGP